MQQNSVLYYVSCILAVGITFSVSYFQDRNNRHRPDWIFRVLSSMAASYMCYFYWPSPKEIQVFHFYPFPTIQIWLGFCSYAGIYIFKNLRDFLKKGPKEWAAIWGERLSAYSKDKK